MLGVISVIRGEKDKVIYVRCNRETWLRFRKFCAEYRDYEECLRYMLDRLEKEKRAIW
ncbi:MAG: hypothetical protein QXV17_02755 [Candidatus Micrarchaeaceae archaeon]